VFALAPAATETGKRRQGISYANQLGVGQGPITGGILLGSDDINGLSDTAEALNLTNRVEVINFASLFSGTAVAPPHDFRFNF
jgi:hypothetical protein